MILINFLYAYIVITSYSIHYTKLYEFSLVFILMGASASYLGSLIYTYKKLIRIIGGILIIILGIHLTGLIRIPGLDFEKRITLEKKPLHFLGTLVIGMAFGAGWSPCIGPLLGSILIIASSQETVWQGVLLLGIYSAGLVITSYSIHYTKLYDLLLRHLLMRH